MTSALIGANPPPPTNREERLRWEHTALRWRMLYRRHKYDVERRITDAVGAERARAWRPIDLSSNPFELTWAQLAALYHDEPEMVGPADDVLTAVAESGFWALSQRLQRDTLGLRELPILCDLDEDGQPLAHVIPPHRCTLEVDARRPGVVIAAHWWEPDPRDDGKWVEYHIDPREPAYWATNEKGEDASEVLESAAGTYPWMAKGKIPVQPVVLYHAAETGQTWDPYAGLEVVEGSLNLCVHYTHYGHAVRHAAHRQKWMLGATVRTGETDEGGVRQITADAATVLDLEQDEGASNAQIGQWDSSVNLDQMISSIRQYERRLIEQAVGGVEVTRETSDIRSGYSLAVGRESQILAQERYAPVRRRGDRLALKVWSALLGTARGQDYPLAWPTRTGERVPTFRGGTRAQMDIEYQIGIAADKDAADAPETDSQPPSASTSQPRDDAPKPEADQSPERRDDVAADAAETKAVALNGAQVQAAQGIVVDVASGSLPREVGIQMLVTFFGLPPDVADNVMGTVGKSFRPAAE